MEEAGVRDSRRAAIDIANNIILWLLCFFCSLDGTERVMVKEVVIFCFVFGELEKNVKDSRCGAFCRGLEIILPCLNVGISYDGLLEAGPTVFLLCVLDKTCRRHLRHSLGTNPMRTPCKKESSVVSLSFRAQVLLFGLLYSSKNKESDETNVLLL